MNFLIGFTTLLLTFSSVFSVQFDQDDIAYGHNVSVKGKYSTNTYSEAINYGKTHPTRDGSSWSGW